MIGTKRFQLIRKSFVASLMATVIGTSMLLLTTALVSCGSDGTEEMKETKDTTPPSISLHLQEVNVLGGKQVKISGNKLSIGTADVASWTDNSRSTCTAQLTMDGATINNLTTIDKEGTLKLTVTDPSGNASSADIKLTVSGILGLESLKLLNLQVDEEVNLLEGITFGNGTSLTKVQIEIDGGVKDISDPTHFIPDVPGTCNIILITKNKEGKNEEHKVENLTIKPLEYNQIEIQTFDERENMPFIGKIVGGRRNGWESIKHFGISECIEVINNIKKYGTSKYSPEQIQQLEKRLHLSIMGEQDVPSHKEKITFIINAIEPTRNLNHIDWSGESIEQLCQNQPKDAINLINLSQSTYSKSKESYNRAKTSVNFEKYINDNKILLVCSASNIVEMNNNLIVKIVHENIELDEHSTYSVPQSQANKDNNILITVGTNTEGNAYWNKPDGSYISSGSVFPIGFDPESLLAGRTFPVPVSVEEGYYFEDGMYTSSYATAANTGMIAQCFKMKPDIKDVNELKKLVRESSETEQIHLDGKTLYLSAPSPAGFFKKYCMPTTQSLPVKQSETKSLEKGSYKGIVFNIPGAEVNINGQWIAFDGKNRDAIMAQNPFSMKWRISGVLLRKLGYKQGDTVKGQFVTVDDKWSGLSFLTKEFTVTVE